MANQVSPTETPLLFTPLTVRSITFKNRIVVSPMCQYSAVDGVPNDWHLVHLGSRAVGGAGLVFTEATAVSPEGRISPADLGIWNDEQVGEFSKITHFIKAQGSVPGIQIAHAGRKSSQAAPWEGGDLVPESKGGWQPIAPSAIPFEAGDVTPRELITEDFVRLKKDFKIAAENALKAGFQVLEIHAAHGYLLHEFLSPISNQRTDQYGGELKNRMRFPLEIAKQTREIWPAAWPVFVRISACDWAEGGFELTDAIQFVKELKTLGIDVLDCSSGGSVPHPKVKPGPGYQVFLSEAIRKETKILTGAVGIITEAQQAETILKKGEADFIFLARELLRDPYWPLHAAKVLQFDFTWPNQYERAKR